MCVSGEADSQGASGPAAGPRVLRGDGHVCGASLLRLRDGAGQEQGDGTRHTRCPREEFVAVHAFFGLRHFSLSLSLSDLVPGRQRGDRPRTDQRPTGLCVQSGTINNYIVGILNAAVSLV